MEKIEENKILEECLNKLPTKYLFKIKKYKDEIKRLTEINRSLNDELSDTINKLNEINEENTYLKSKNLTFNHENEKNDSSSKNKKYKLSLLSVDDKNCLKNKFRKISSRLSVENFHFIGDKKMRLLNHNHEQEKSNEQLNTLETLLSDDGDLIEKEYQLECNIPQGNQFQNDFNDHLNEHNRKSILKQSNNNTQDRYEIKLTTFMENYDNKMLFLKFLLDCLKKKNNNHVILKKVFINDIFHLIEAKEHDEYLNIIEDYLKKYRKSVFLINNTNNKYKMDGIKEESESHPIEFHGIIKSVETKFSQLSNIFKNLNKKSLFTNINDTKSLPIRSTLKIQDSKLFSNTVFNLMLKNTNSNIIVRETSASFSIDNTKYQNPISRKKHYYIEIEISFTIINDKRIFIDLKCFKETTDFTISSPVKICMNIASNHNVLNNKTEITTSKIQYQLSKCTNLQLNSVKIDESTKEKLKDFYRKYLKYSDLFLKDSIREAVRKSINDLDPSKETKFSPYKILMTRNFFHFKY